MDNQSLIEDIKLVKCLQSHQESNMVGSVPDLVLCCVKCKPLKSEITNRLWIVEFLSSSNRKGTNFEIVKKKVIYLDDDLQSPAVKARMLKLDKESFDLGIKTLSYRHANKSEVVWFLGKKLVAIQDDKV